MKAVILIFKMGMEGTKWQLFRISIDLFAARGYPNVSIRDIAATADIRSSSIYYHFESKEEILQQIYAYYEKYFILSLPSLDDLLVMTETEPPVEVLLKITFRYEPPLRDLMEKIFGIISIEALCGDADAERLIDLTMFQTSEQYLRALLARMLALGKIRPVNIESTILTFCSLCHSCMLRAKSCNVVDWALWRESIVNLFNTLIPA